MRIWRNLKGNILTRRGKGGDLPTGGETTGSIGTTKIVGSVPGRDKTTIGM
jgi:hypothetical protein